MEEQIQISPYVGKPLKVPWFREKKKGKFRVYYLIYDEFLAVFFVYISEKKDQQKTINTVLALLDEFRAELIGFMKN